MKPLVLRNILVATDLSQEMIPAIQSARTLGELSGAEVHLLHSIEDPAKARHVNERIVGILAGAGADFEVTVLTGPAGAVITQEAARTEADVIILGRHRSRAGAPGSTADRVVRTTRVPCLILPGHLALPLASVLVPVDVTESARGALAVALTWASALRRRHPDTENPATRLRALYVHSRADDAEQDHLLPRLGAEVALIRERLGNVAGVVIDQQMNTHDDIAAAILEQAEAAKADLIVIGTRGERIETDPLGSVSSEVVKHASTPILLVPPEVWRLEDPVVEGRIREVE